MRMPQAYHKISLSHANFETALSHGLILTPLKSVAISDPPRPQSRSGEQRYLILEYKDWMFGDMVYQDNWTSRGHDRQSLFSSSCKSSLPFARAQA
jgi:hypothetical protein